MIAMDAGTDGASSPAARSRLRQHPRHREREEFFRRAEAPGFGRVTAPGDPVPSPDGDRVAFVGRVAGEPDGSTTSRIYVVPVGGDTPPLELTGGPHDACPRWGPDGSLAFLSDRETPGRMQLRVVVTEGAGSGEVRAMPEIPGTLEDIAWSPDGTRLLALGAGASADGPEMLRRLWIVDLRTGGARQISRAGLNVWEAAWCGDDALVAIASEGADESAWYRAPLVHIDAASGDERVLFRSKLQLARACGSSDGSRAAVIEAPASDRLLTEGMIHVIDTHDGTVRSAVLDGGDIGWIDWRDSRTLAWRGVRGTMSVLGSVDTSAPQLELAELWTTNETLNWVASFAGADGEHRFCVVRESFDRPPELATVVHGAARTIAVFAHEGHQYLRSFVERAELLSWESFDGTRIEGFLLTPAGEGPFPLILAVHGGPTAHYQAAFLDPETAMLLESGYALLMPNPRGSTGRGRRFVEGAMGDLGGGEARDHLAGLDAMVERGIADPDRIGVMGGSHAGYMSAWLPCVDQRFAVAVSLVPATDWLSWYWDAYIGSGYEQFLGGSPTSALEHLRDRSPVFHADRLRTPMLLIAGSEDRASPPGQISEYYRALRAQGVPAEMAVYPGEGHHIGAAGGSREDLQTRILTWLEHFMPPLSTDDA